MAEPKTQYPGVALVTGSASGIGAATAYAFASRGCPTLILTDLNEASLEKVKSEILSEFPSCSILLFPGDVASVNFVTTSLFPSIRSAPSPFAGHLDYAVNCAGIMGPAKPTTELTVDELDHLTGINYRGLWLCEKEELKIMISQEIRKWTGARTEQEAETRGSRGSIVNIASQLGIVGRPEAPAYCASKAAVSSLVRTDAIDYSKHRIRINAICPGVIATPMTTSTAEKIERLGPAVEIAPMKRMGLPEEVADAAVWLSGGEASFVQGSNLVVDGGYVIN